MHIDLDTSGEKPELCTVVGVVADSRTLDVRRPPEPELFFSVRQFGTGSLFVFVRVDSVEGPALPVMRQLASEASTMPNGVTLWAVQDVLRQTWQEPRFRSVSVTLLAGCILVLSCFGIYGVTAQATKQRQREFAIRGALGATGRDIATVVLREAVATTGAGIVAGSLLALSGSDVLDSVLYGVSALEWPVWTVVLLLVGAASIAASLVPALRATALETRALYSDSD
jgi:ABC-type antimicrobial peptide transport system permease subunit